MLVLRRSALSRALSRRRVVPVSRRPLKYARRNLGPAFKSGKAAGITVCHREFIQDVTTGQVVGGTSVFDTQIFPLQVGSPGTFPWLSQLATNFEQYNLKRVKFEFISTCADGTAAATNNSLGTVMGAVEYNVYGAVPQNKQQLENMYMSRSSKPSTSQSWYVDCLRQHAVLKDLYIRGGNAPPAGQDQRLYDYGYFVLATQGMQAQNVIGELWVSYEVEMMKPQMVGLGSSGVAALTQVGWSYQQPATVTSRYGGLLWFDDNYIQFSQSQAMSRQAGFNIRSPPVAAGVVNPYPNSTIALNVPSASTRMNVGTPTVVSPNYTAVIRESTYPVTPWAPFPGLSQQLSYVDQMGILLESICPNAVPGTSAAPSLATSGGMCIYFPPTLAGPHRINYFGVLTNAIPPVGGGPVALATSAGVRGILMHTTYNDGTDAGGVIGVSNVNTSWFQADTDTNNNSACVFISFTASVMLSPSAGAYEWLTLSNAGSCNGFTTSYSQMNLSVEALPESVGNTYQLV